jgi:hypothetical protein
MLDWLGNALGAIVSGGATGLLGALVTTWGELAKVKEINRHEETMRRQDHEIAKTEAEGKLAIAKTEGEAAIGVAEAQTLSASYQHDRATYATGELTPRQRWLMVLVDFARGMIRPGETLYFTGLLTYLTFVAVSLLARLSPEQLEATAADLVSQVFLVVLYLTTTVILWWFGARQKVFK